MCRGRIGSFASVANDSLNENEPDFQSTKTFYFSTTTSLVPSLSSSSPNSPQRPQLDPTAAQRRKAAAVETLEFTLIDSLLFQD